MIRLRCETGRFARSGDKITPDLWPAGWIDLALLCGFLQARSIVASGRKLVPLAALAESNCPQTPLSLYNLSILELRTWDEHPSGAITRVRQVDLSVTAAQILRQNKLLPACFLPCLVSHELLDGNVRTDPLLEAEFLSWLECGGLGGNVLTPSAALEPDCPVLPSAKPNMLLASGRQRPSHTGPTAS